MIEGGGEGEHKERDVCVCERDVCMSEIEEREGKGRREKEGG